MPCVLLLSRDELPDVVSLEAELFPDPWSLGQFQNGHDQGTCRIHGVRDHMTLVGYISCQVLPPEMEILNMAVLPGFRRRGMGRELVTAAMDHGSALGVVVCHLEVDETNIAALHLYTSLGFSRIGRRRGYYPHPEGARDAVLMRRDPRSVAASRGPMAFANV
ncbi:ribosomal protein S18-alanine N-acetyltransferase [Desulfonatronum sp. SC1]|uniref:ribosomal protein S18-alanine N-acetyltransferase n=1 Tax=Desulfonatronum sp. SC1 TaxID=2109626 RepID=UPI000D31E1FB|nr:ribosomal protein S18-alanine N-acetyltransferase [Desulfonatronum sp. SC1]PTN38717.1 ribosomal-protein-alanine N-acetyltransferase [Desulfonatronum sp. SC1]